ncbi:MAG: hypothetical protein NT001_06200, partial [Candidatus Woesearchaeota archaeon]|nr:hypothetical protein [Candidatus Woesearchaeota archaeon]
MRQIKLKVAEAIQDDVNKGMVRIDPKFMKKIGIKPGDIVAIKGQRTAAAIADSAYPGDADLDIIRMDGITRRNAEAGIGEYIGIKKADFKEAESIVISPAREGIHVNASQNMLKTGLLGKAFVKGDMITFTGTASKTPFFEDIFSMLNQGSRNPDFSDIKFIVESTAPKGILIATDNTHITMKEGKKHKSRMPLKYSRSKKTLTIRRKILAKALGVKPKDIEKVV